MEQPEWDGLTYRCTKMINQKGNKNSAQKDKKKNADEKQNKKDK